MKLTLPSAPVLLSVIVAFLALGCSPGPGERTYPLTGQILGVDQDRREILLKHDEIPGYMSAMTMPFRVSDDTSLDGYRRGDLISATLVIADNTAVIRDLATTGFSEVVDEAPAAARSGFELIEKGAEVPDVELLDQDGRSRPFSSWRGQLIALTFIFTRCPLPTFCPLMDRHFASIQAAVADDPALREQVSLLSVSFDPDYDTPEVLARHAARVGAEPPGWTFVTGERDEIDRFAMRFGLSIVRSERDPLDIAHNLRTVVIDHEGRLAAVYQGNEWTPGQILEVLRRLADAR